MMHPSRGNMSFGQHPELDINSLVLNNVNACGGNTALLTPPHLTHISTTLYPIFSRWALTVYITPCYAAPMSEGMGLPKLDGVDPLAKEDYLSDDAFFATFRMDRAAWADLARWRRLRLKREAGLF